jgi:dihydroorotase
MSVVLSGAALLGGQRADVVIEAGVIVEIGRRRSGDRVIDADGLVLLPGFVDLHTHLREPGREDAETIATGSAAAALGGFAAVHAMANTDPVADNAEIVEQVARLGAQAGLVDVRPVGAVSKGLAGQTLAEIGNMARSAAAIRLFSDDGHCVHDARLMRRALEYVKPFDAAVAQHAQDPRLADDAACAHEGDLSGRLGLPGWPSVAEESIIARDVLLAAHVGSRLHVCHVSTAGSVEVIRWAKQRGVQVTAEVTPHHLLLTCDLLEDYDPIFKVNPPLRLAADVEALRVGLADGTIDAVATDHAPHAPYDKDHAFGEAAFGMLGLETALGVVALAMVETGLLDWAGVADRMSVRPAAIGRLPGHGRPIAVGEPANLTLVDPSGSWTVDPDRFASRSRNTPFAGRTLPAAVVATFLRGRPTVLDRALAADELGRVQ